MPRGCYEETVPVEFQLNTVMRRAHLMKGTLKRTANESNLRVTLLKVFVAFLFMEESVMKLCFV